MSNVKILTESEGAGALWDLWDVGEILLDQTSGRSSERYNTCLKYLALSIGLEYWNPTR